MIHESLIEQYRVESVSSLKTRMMVTERVDKHVTAHLSSFAAPFCRNPKRRPSPVILRVSVAKSQDLTQSTKGLAWMLPTSRSMTERMQQDGMSACTLTELNFEVSKYFNGYGTIDRRQAYGQQ